jgi:hypothetical protein
MIVKNGVPELRSQLLFFFAEVHWWQKPTLLDDTEKDFL